ncbi:hypothetical protein MTO96_038564 [Rhipicephalus appendiculatus]
MRTWQRAQPTPRQLESRRGGGATSLPMQGQMDIKDAGGNAPAPVPSPVLIPGPESAQAADPTPAPGDVTTMPDALSQESARTPRSSSTNQERGRTKPRWVLNVV